MKYREALDYLLSFADLERAPGHRYAFPDFNMRRMELLLERLGNPHLHAKSIHIAGSKGKGSTAVMIARAISAAGYRTGLYTSPHLHTFRERISLEGKPIAEEEMAALVETLPPAVEAVHANGACGELTTFELLTALAFLYFREKGVHFQVLEVGLGGRLDATNVINPEVCVITSISLDHVAVLGDTLARIAAEKAGIIKPGTTVVSSPQSEEAAAVIRERCREKGARLIAVGEDVTWQKRSASLTGQSLQVRGRLDSYDLAIPLLGDHQLENAAAAVAALEVLGIPKGSIASGLAQAHWPGRLEVLQLHPLLVVDGAHNAYSAKRLIEALPRYFDFDRLILIIGMSGDKDMASMVKELASFPNTVIVTRSHHPRSMEPSALLAEFEKAGIKAQRQEKIQDAVAQARAMAGERDLVLSTGSLFVVAEVIQVVKGIRGDEELLKESLR